MSNPKGSESLQIYARVFRKKIRHDKSQAIVWVTLNPFAQALEEARAELDQHSAAREALTDDLVGLAAGLRRNAEAMAQRAGEGRGLMDRTEQLLEGNLARAGAANADAKAALSRGWWRGIGTKLGMLLTVGLAFLGIYLFLKASSMAGYSHQAAPSSSAAGAAPPPPPRLDPATVPPEAPPGAVGPAPPEL